MTNPIFTPHPLNCNGLFFTVFPLCFSFFLVHLSKCDGWPPHRKPQCCSNFSQLRTLTKIALTLVCWPVNKKNTIKFSGLVWSNKNWHLTSWTGGYYAFTGNFWMFKKYSTWPISSWTGCYTHVFSSQDKKTNVSPPHTHPRRTVPAI